MPRVCAGDGRDRVRPVGYCADVTTAQIIYLADDAESDTSGVMALDQNSGVVAWGPSRDEAAARIRQNLTEQTQRAS